MIFGAKPSWDGAMNEFRHPMIQEMLASAHVDLSHSRFARTIAGKIVWDVSSLSKLLLSARTRIRGYI